MSFAKYADYDGLGLAELVRNKDVSPAELIESAIERAERHNGKLNALVHKAYDMARANAKHLPDGPFKGVPFLIKDLGLEVAGQVVVFEQDSVLEGLMPAFNLALGHGVIGRAANVIHVLAVEPFGEVGRDVARTVV